MFGRLNQRFMYIEVQETWLFHCTIWVKNIHVCIFQEPWNLFYKIRRYSCWCVCWSEQNEWILGLWLHRWTAQIIGGIRFIIFFRKSHNCRPSGVVKIVGEKWLILWTKHYSLYFQSEKSNQMNTIRQKSYWRSFAIRSIPALKIGVYDGGRNDDNRFRVKYKRKWKSTTKKPFK